LIGWRVREASGAGKGCAFQLVSTYQPSSIPSSAFLCCLFSPFCRVRVPSKSCALCFFKVTCITTYFSLGLIASLIVSLPTWNYDYHNSKHTGPARTSDFLYTIHKLCPILFNEVKDQDRIPGSTQVCQSQGRTQEDFTRTFAKACGVQPQQPWPGCSTIARHHDDTFYWKYQTRTGNCHFRSCSFNCFANPLNRRDSDWCTGSVS
jgi:hypothetical protein